MGRCLQCTYPIDSLLSKINLNKRIAYLSHALMCIQAAEETRTNLELKMRISDQLDVARVQQKVR